MRKQAFLLILLAGAAMPASAQTERADRRIEKLEAEMRAVQRKVFPGGRSATVEPEIGPAQVAAAAPGIPAGSAVADLTARIDALESALARLTGQSEENGNKLRQLEASFTSMRSDFEARLAAQQQAAVQPQAVQRVTEAEPVLAQEASAVVQGGGDADPEQAYLAGFKLWEQKKYSDARKALDDMAKRHPNHPKASWARNLAGRALLDAGQPAAAAKALFANYETDPKGERAADSLFYLGQALTQLKKTTEACQVYGELRDAFGASLRDQIKRDLPRARKAAGCGG